MVTAVLPPLRRLGGAPSRHEAYNNQKLNSLTRRMQLVTDGCRGVLTAALRCRRPLGAAGRVPLHSPQANCREAGHSSCPLTAPRAPPRHPPRRRRHLQQARGGGKRTDERCCRAPRPRPGWLASAAPEGGGRQHSQPARQGAQRSIREGTCILVRVLLLLILILQRSRGTRRTIQSSGGAGGSAGGARARHMQATPAAASEALPLCSPPHPPLPRRPRHPPRDPPHPTQFHRRRRRRQPAYPWPPQPAPLAPR